jgi:hypothetical protein
MWIPTIRRNGRRDTVVDVEVFVVERFLVGWSADEVEDLVHRLDDAGPRLAEQGVRHLDSIVIPGDETCLSVFAGPDADTVRSANVELALPVGRVLAATSQAGHR